MAGADEIREVTPPPRNAWLAPSETKRFAALGDVIYALTVVIAVMLSFGVGVFWGETVGILTMLAAPAVWLVGCAIRHKLCGGPFFSSW